MFDYFLMQTTQGESFVNSAWGLFIAIAGIFATVSAIAIKIATNLKARLKDSTNENHKKIVSIIDDYILPILSTGNEFVDKTKTQEEKLKEFGNILYEFMGPKADEITNKPKVTIDNLTNDVNTANVQAIEYKKKLDRLMELMGELKNGVGAGGEPTALSIDAAKAKVPPTTAGSPIP